MAQDAETMYARCLQEGFRTQCPSNALGCLTTERRESDDSIGMLELGCKSRDACENLMSQNFLGETNHQFNCRVSDRESTCFKCCYEGTVYILK